MEAIATRIVQVMLAAVLVERLLEGLHRFHWTRRFKEHLIGVGDGSGVLPPGWLREFVGCKFCQSWWAGWGAAVLILSTTGVAPRSGGWAFVFDIFWVGLVSGSLANFIHHLRDIMSAAVTRLWR